MRLLFDECLDEEEVAASIDVSPTQSRAALKGHSRTLGHDAVLSLEIELDYDLAVLDVTSLLESVTAVEVFRTSGTGDVARHELARPGCAHMFGDEVERTPTVAVAL